ncbi:MAG: transposase, partial [Trueperaceae bacterium]|nr:transposase [Trueperaceae bacterium]
MGKKKVWSAEQKLTIVLTALKEQQSIAELSRQHGVAESLIHKWKSQFFEHGKSAFKHGNVKTPDQALAAENEQLKKVLGEKVLEVEILKKL